MKIVLTGGGTAGHVTPNLALIPALKSRGFAIEYIGAHTGMERELVTAVAIPYHGISAGKLRRYLSFKNMTDAFRVLRGAADARRILKKIRPDVVFSKGGFVTVPVVFAAASLGIPVVIHESDFSVGLANRLSIPRAAKVLCVFPETLAQIPGGKGIVTGTPIRREILDGSRIAGAKLFDFPENKPVLLVTGGSQGSAAVNACVRAALEGLLADFNIIHSTGKGNIDDSFSQKGYLQFDYIGRNMGDIYALADIIISRAGANSIGEFLALAKPNLLIPLSKKASRGDQILNARSFEKQGFSAVIEEETLTPEGLTSAVGRLYKNRGRYIAAMKKAGGIDPAARIVGIIEDAAKSKLKKS